MATMTMTGEGWSREPAPSLEDLDEMVGGAFTSRVSGPGCIVVAHGPPLHRPFEGEGDVDLVVVEREPTKKSQLLLISWKRFCDHYDATRFDVYEGNDGYQDARELCGSPLALAIATLSRAEQHNRMKRQNLKANVWAVSLILAGVVGYLLLRGSIVLG